MNDLSILIYLTSLVGKASNILGAVLFFGGLLVSIGVVFYFACADEYDAAEKSFRKLYPRFTAVWVFCGLLYLAIPTQDAMYAIAASEVGEEIVQSEVAGKALKAVEAWIDTQLAPPAPTP